MSEGGQAGTVESNETKAAPQSVAQSVAHSFNQEAGPPTGLPIGLPIGVGIASGLQFRMDERYEVEGDAEVVINSGSLGTSLLRGRILDISATGCYIQTMARVHMKPGTEVEINFSIYGTSFRIDAVSRFAKVRVGVGFRFREMDEVTRKRLQSVLADIRSRLIETDAEGALPVVERTTPE